MSFPYLKVPHVGSTTCDGVSAGAVEDVAATVTLDVQRIFRLVTIASGTAKFGITAEIRNLDKNRLVAYQLIGESSQGSVV